ncbi:Ankyrin repeat protein [Aspergillus sclerotialis]|uniref:Ankyrin repeat protein n=1 Tax=Aspergillus sclerotialis TaxID=2070753 RepID=A0A3A2Z7H2_9EURO|nr:Ankyrin repeat protein [Aspergillus sclerotialis]
METLLDKHYTDVNAVHQGSTPLIKAVISGSLAAVEQGNRALWYSAAQKDAAIAQQLLCHPGIDINARLRAKSGKALTIFNEAVIRNNLEIVVVLLADKRIDPNIVGENLRTPQTPLLYTTDRRHVNIVKLLLEDSRVDGAYQDDRGYNALHYAAENGDVLIVDLLLADSRIDNTTRQGHGQIASRLLIKEDVEVNTIGTGESTERSTSLHYTVEERNLALVHQLLAKSTADPNVPDKDRQTPLWWAVNAGDPLLVISLLEDPRTQRYTKDKSGRTPVDVAKSRCDHDLLYLLSNCRYYCPAVMFAEAVILSPVLFLLYLVAAMVKWALSQDHILE